MRRYVAVEGSVGAGKTTLLDGLREAGYSVMREPVHEWTRQAETGGSPLSAAYSDPARNALSFQVRVLASKNAQFASAPLSGRPTVIERDPFETGTFIRHALDKGRLTAQEHDDVAYLASELRRASGGVRLGTIYLRAPPEECLRRVRERGRPEESGMTPLDMQDLHRVHEARYGAAGSARVIDASLSREDVLRSAIAFIEGLEEAGS
jgi:deoxyadenosine/deoxycytidine kinase